VSEAERAKSIRCPKCTSYDVRRSYPKGLLDAWMARLGSTPLRCRRCSYRFYRKLLAGEVLGIPEISGAEPRV
jgi:hypothetical protein